MLQKINIRGYSAVFSCWKENITYIATAGVVPVGFTFNAFKTSGFRIIPQRY